MNKRLARYVADENSVLVMQSKRSMIHALVTITRLCLDYRIRLLIHAFRTEDLIELATGGGDVTAASHADATRLSAPAASDAASPSPSRA